MALASPMVLRAGPVTAQIMPEGDGTTALWGFNGSTPGPELRARVGDMLNVRFENGIGSGSAIHWHGIRIENGMDGVPGLTQPLVEAGAEHDYSFRLPDAGTFWYHSHHRSWEQVERGLYGALIIEEETPPEVNHDITVIVDDWRIERTGELIEDFGNRHDFAHGGRMGTFARIVPTVSTVRKGDRVRLRIINTATARIFPLEITGITGKIVALDGMPLAQPRDLERSVLAPAQRMDVIADVTDTVQFLFPTGQDPYPLGDIAVDGENPTPITAPIAALPQPRISQPAATPDHRLTMRLEGGAMGGRHAGDDIWSLNGVSNLPDAPWQRFARGDTVQITIVNDTAFPHGMHLHGHHFHELEEDGSPGPLRDTTLLMRGQSRDILCVFDNPGKWLLHCHMLGHQASGMKTWLEVA
ncbi:multicopper oxidase family protein [Aestuariivita boseongensis]|uniref:multicopper oxidase family protein n=1 Tax=Aestuariivita boseongensis TaxID=1470562 RepID=UPI001FE1E291|nr:multicopper oxidase family protein [Aestuariivita boseongensis]